jgi:hypothetical protein
MRRNLHDQLQETNDMIVKWREHIHPDVYRWYTERPPSMQATLFRPNSSNSEERKLKYTYSSNALPRIIPHPSTHNVRSTSNMKLPAIVDHGHTTTGHTRHLEVTRLPKLTDSKDNLVASRTHLGVMFEQ